MTIKNEIRLRDFEAWSGAIDTKDVILDNGKEDMFEELINELYPEGLSETELNDLLWFDDEWLYEQLGIEIEE